MASSSSVKIRTAKPVKSRSDRDLIFGDLWEFDPAPESADPKLKERYDLFIDGKFVSPKGRKYFDSINPANEHKIARIAHAKAADVDLAYKAAKKALDGGWGTMPGRERAKYIYRIARLLQDRAREFAVAETIDGGKPIKESRDFDVPTAAAHFFYHAGWADKLDYVAPGRKVAPLGVVGQVIPWNFPLLMLAWKIAPALAMGNCIVIKPAETTSITALKLGEIVQDAGLPPGVVNIVSGFGDTGSAIMTHPIAAKVAFTGSTEVGKIIMRSIADTDKKMTMELGGKAANIVFDDAPIDQAVEGIVNGIFFNQGHVCCAGSRLLVQESVAPQVLRKLENRIKVLRVGDPMDKNTDIGAINSKEQLDKITELVDSGVKEGAAMFQSACKLPRKGYYFKPTVFSNVTMSHRIAQEEIFGPVLSVMTFRTLEEAVEKANNTPFGLSAGVWTDKGSRILKMSTELKAGVVWANTYNKFDPTSPFGGYKESGFGREGGRQGLLDYCKLV
ncbi:MAG: betaine-aldehyde dehydrogenase [Opitutaceae bacterium]|nr:betaine-aldehyde dehydrogenase [Opitutaceae bacterium]|tara:strand:- start:322 stop:1833 length:1512 start_codon:yes stop_codon:yes gene_type:complete